MGKRNTDLDDRAYHLVREQGKSLREAGEALGGIHRWLVHKMVNRAEKGRAAARRGKTGDACVGQAPAGPVGEPAHPAAPTPGVDVEAERRASLERRAARDAAARAEYGQRRQVPVSAYQPRHTPPATGYASTVPPTVLLKSIRRSSQRALAESVYRAAAAADDC
ncbi:MAG TPA: hypothetical protein VFJ16_31295 [Longimicrobium sp.]|nr:hypothetical protein [Longimicrobium sp.]